MFLEVDEIVVSKKVWGGAWAGVETDRQTLREQLAGMVCYMHAFSNPAMATHQVVTLRELEQAGVITSVQISTHQQGHPQL